RIPVTCSSHHVIIVTLFTLLPRRPPISPLLPYPTLFRSLEQSFPFPPGQVVQVFQDPDLGLQTLTVFLILHRTHLRLSCLPGSRSEEHTSELQSRENLVCRLLLEKKKNFFLNESASDSIC